jgi:D-alanyl-lipoteichoic acid acyltransferase DltB (MBOAT superfamily)
LTAGIAASMAPLILFKYFNFGSESFERLATIIGWNYPIETLSLILPVGISFYTFQTMSYVIDVYNKKIKPEKNLGIYSLFISFFPQLVAGPIERPDNLIPQFHIKHRFDIDRAREGLSLMAWGMFKKVVIADNAAVIVNRVYSDVGAYTGLPLILATLLFAIQIYCDFSGYTDIARGAARVMGFKLIKNFDRPYFSKSISEFWRRWHMSLSSWFRDYVYIPLGGNRVVKWRWYYNLFITFLLSGLWHGAAWTFVFWGALHGIYLIVGELTKRERSKLKLNLGIQEGKILDKSWRVLVTGFLVCIGWVFFRAQSFSDAVYVLNNSFTNLYTQIYKIDSFDYVRRLLKVDSVDQLQILLLSIFVLIAVEFWQRKPSYYKRFLNMPIYVRWSTYYILIFSIIFLGATESQQFIYFQF